MLKRTRLERRALAFLRGTCRGLQRVLNQQWEDKAMLNTILEMYRKNVEQVWLAMHDPLNIWGTALRFHIDPRFARHGGDYCLINFQEMAGAEFSKEFENGLR